MESKSLTVVELYENNIFIKIKNVKQSKQSNPNYKPWLYPEQMTIPRIDWKDIISIDVNQMKAANVGDDESQVKETDVDKAETNEDNE